MFHPCETKCNGHVSVHRNCNMQSLTSRAYALVRKCSNKRTLAYFYLTHFSGVSELHVGAEEKNQPLCLCLYREEIEQ